MFNDAPDVLEDDDVLEMVNAGLAPITVVDDYLAEFWSKVFTEHQGTPRYPRALRRQPGRRVSQGEPPAPGEVNKWIRKHGKGDAFRNTIERRYLQSLKYAKNAAAEAERRKLRKVIGLFKKYGAQSDLDYLLMAAQGYQESTLDQNVKSPVGAIGVMQVMPATGKELKVGDITRVEPNIHAGVKYVRFMMDQYFKDEPMDNLNKALMTFAAYNAGPGRIRQLRRETEKRGLNPNVWFGNVERLASERIGRETVTYVSNIYKYYVAYRLISEQRDRRSAAKAEVGKAQVNEMGEVPGALPRAERPGSLAPRDGNRLGSRSQHTVTVDVSQHPERSRGKPAALSEPSNPPGPRPGNLRVQQDQDEHREVGAAQRPLMRTALRQAHRGEQPSEPGHRRERVRRDAKREQRRVSGELDSSLRRDQTKHGDQRLEHQSAPGRDRGKRAQTRRLDERRRMEELGAFRQRLEEVAVLGHLIA